MAIDPATVSAVGTVLTQGKAILRGLRQSNLANEHRDKVNDALDLIDDVTDRLLGLQTALLALQQQNSELRAEIAAAEDWKSRIAPYRLFQSKLAIVYAADVPLKHFACPVCIEASKKIHILQRRAVDSGLFDCKGCKAYYFLEEST
jgi:hypothetical protein